MAAGAYTKLAQTPSECMSNASRSVDEKAC